MLTNLKQTTIITKSNLHSEIKPVVPNYLRSMGSFKLDKKLNIKADTFSCSHLKILDGNTTPPDPEERLSDWSNRD